MRKKASLKPKDKIMVGYSGSDQLNKTIKGNKKYILETASVKSLILGDKPKHVFLVEREIKIDGQRLWLAIKKLINN